jgi:hypothetical protein
MRHHRRSETDKQDAVRIVFPLITIGLRQRIRVLISRAACGSTAIPADALAAAAGSEITYRLFAARP